MTCRVAAAAGVARAIAPDVSVVAMLLVVSASASAVEAPDFNREIRPILSRNCFACHGPDEHDRQGGLRLDDRAAATTELESGLTAIVPGKPAESELVARIHATDPDVVMPPPESNHVLTAAQKDLLERWIAAGAPYAAHWAYVPPVAAPDPAVKDPTWAETWIDRFLLARLEAEGLAPAPEADKVTLLRRVTFDLTGLPPTPAEVDAYLADTRPDAYELLIARLLASPRHAERLAAWWLDLVRYADTVGYHGDQTHAASPYRDWVIAAFLANLPFDRFTILQLAGDLVEPLPGEHPDDRVLAAAYNRLLQTTHEGGLQVKEYRAIYQADRIRNVSGTWLGATVGCAQCHDHKYDPYTARDFYALGSFFADIDDEKHMGNGGFGGAPNALPTTRLPERPMVGPFDRERAAAVDSEIAALRASLPPAPKKDPPAKKPPVKPAAAGEQDGKGGDKRGEDAKDGGTPAPPPEPPEVVAQRKRLAELEAQRKRLARSLMVTQALKEPRTVRILPRGNWMDDSGEAVLPAIPAFLGALATDGRATRADLARWLVRPVAEGGAGEFTARVTANRLWAIFFGAGLCRSADDFGGQGEPPDHPALLDRLALELADGWDIRDLIRTIVTSRAYRQASDASPELLARDPDNRLLARQGRWRYPAEGVRDAALLASGLLVEELGGASVHPYQPAGYYRHLNFPQREYKADTDQRQWRRGLYVHWQRMFLHPQLLAFDAPTREECTAVRMRSNTPKAALVLLNDPTFVEAARKLAERVLKEAGDDPARIEALWRHTVSRRPDAEEQNLVTDLLARRRLEYAADHAAARELLAVGLAPRDTSLDDAELAAWTATARAVLNLHEAIGRY
jgi:mono/diheme cytochrome c family protein